jgi:hypothetical protein
MTLITYYINYFLFNTCTLCYLIHVLILASLFFLQLIERRCLGHAAARVVAAGVSYGLMLHLCTYGL